ncbi:MAG: EAL domain-containing protein [Synergistaceae bacterium]|nr:EAL domain-containing protein [Synergistaceae bacterium]
MGIFDALGQTANLRQTKLGWIRTAASEHLAIIRNSLTLMLPIVIAGAFGILINNFPISGYQAFMKLRFGENWRFFGAHIWNGTLAVLSPLTVFAIGFGMAERYSSKCPLEVVSPAIGGLVSFCCLMVMVEPLQATFAAPYAWLGIHGLFLAIVCGIVSSWLFLGLYRLKLLRVRYFSEDAGDSVTVAFSSLVPGVLTICAFAIFKTIAAHAGVSDVHELIYDAISAPFKGMGNNLSTALIYNLARHILWFFGIHGSNALEPAMTELYDSAMMANELAEAAGEPLPYILTRSFFDTYVSIGGAGGTLSLIIALLFTSRAGGLRRIAQISLIPALFNINETMLFGLPIVLNPTYLVPFIAIPIITTVTSYMAVSFGMVQETAAQVPWTTPVIVGGYISSGGLTGSVLQLINLAIGVVVYLPFVHAAKAAQRQKFKEGFGELIEAAGSYGDGIVSLVGHRGDIGRFSRALANDLLGVLDRKELFLEYQPQVDCRTGAVVGVEALVRWRHGRIGRIPPSLFIPIAEEIRFIGDIGLWVCDESCRQIMEWRALGLTKTVMSFNVSVRQLDDPDLPEKIGNIIRKHGAVPEYLKMEVTESTGFSSDVEHNLLLQEMRGMGLKVAIDDFGMGHSSLVYLKRFPVATLKLDGSLVRDVTVSKISSDIISSVRGLCGTLDIEMLAEFVETEAQAVTLKNLGCFIFQGYLYSPPLPPGECAAAIRCGFRTF